MNFVSVRVITDDVDRLVGFYETMTGMSATRYAPQFAELHLLAFTLAVAHSDTVQLFGPDSAHAAENHSLFVEFLVDDVDAEHLRPQRLNFERVHTPRTMRWRNGSVLFRDPDGNLDNNDSHQAPIT
jgi:catechol 2,3-dioxygenase-like lactoylglutathione lyase family enzyme